MEVYSMGRNFKKPYNPLWEEKFKAELKTYSLEELEQFIFMCDFYITEKNLTYYKIRLPFAIKELEQRLHNEN